MQAAKDFRAMIPTELVSEVIDSIRDNDMDRLKTLLAKDEMREVIPGSKPLAGFNGWPPLHFAIHHSNAEATQLLLQNGSDPNGGMRLKGLADLTPPLMLAALDNESDCAKLLLDWGADRNAAMADVEGHPVTAFDIARRFGSRDFLDALKEHSPRGVPDLNSLIKLAEYKEVYHVRLKRELARAEKVQTEIDETEALAKHFDDRAEAERIKIEKLKGKDHFRGPERKRSIMKSIKDAEEWKQCYQDLKKKFKQ